MCHPGAAIVAKISNVAQGSWRLYVGPWDSSGTRWVVAYRAPSLLPKRCFLSSWVFKLMTPLFVDQVFYPGEFPTFADSLSKHLSKSCDCRVHRGNDGIMSWLDFEKFILGYVRND